VTTHPDLDDVRLFLAAWGCNTESARATADADPRIRLLTLEQFRRSTATWPRRLVRGGLVRADRLWHRLLP